MDLSIEVLQTETGIQIIDTTTWDGDVNPLRTAVELSFELQQVTDDTNLAVVFPEYDPETVALVELTVVDGHYLVTMTATPDEGDIESVSVSFVSTVSATACRNALRDKVVCKCCKDRKAAIEKYWLANTVLSIIGELATEERYSDAACLIEYMESICEKKPCGCH